MFERYYKNIHIAIFRNTRTQINAQNLKHVRSIINFG